MQGSVAESKTSIPEGAKAHRWDDLVEVVGTEKTPYMENGKKYKVHRTQLEELLKKGAKKA